MKSEEMVWKRGPKKWRTHLQFEQGYWESHYLFYNLILFENKLKNSKNQKKDQKIIIPKNIIYSKYNLKKYQKF